MKINMRFEIESIGGEYCAVPCDKEKFFGVIRLNQTAKEVFELLLNNSTKTEIVEKITTKYDVDEEQFVEELEGILNRLRGLEIIEE